MRDRPDNTSSQNEWVDFGMSFGRLYDISKRSFIGMTRGYLEVILLFRESCCLGAREVDLRGRRTSVDSSCADRN